MPICRKRELQEKINLVEEHYKNLIDALKGGNPNPNIYDQYALNPDEYEQEFVELHEHKVSVAMAAFKTTLEPFKNIKRLEAKKLYRSD